MPQQEQSQQQGQHQWQQRCLLSPSGRAGRRSHHLERREGLCRSQVGYMNKSVSTTARGRNGPSTQTHPLSLLPHRRAPSTSIDLPAVRIEFIDADNI